MTEKPLRILVVDDYPDIRELLVEYLASSGRRVEACPDAATALACLEQDNFDALVIHLQLPDADGGSLLDELTRRGCGPSRVVSMSGSEAGGARRYSRALGCVGHLVKPFKLSDLAALLQ